LQLAASRPFDFAKRFTLAASALLERVLVWHDRAVQRRGLAELNDHLLKDIDLSRADAMHESSKHFWQE
jgi:uncharacterized protein YjiS (DUF1127 family)